MRLSSTEPHDIKEPTILTLILLVSILLNAMRELPASSLFLLIEVKSVDIAGSYSRQDKRFVVGG